MEAISRSLVEPTQCVFRSPLLLLQSTKEIFLFLCGVRPGEEEEITSFDSIPPPNPNGGRRRRRGEPHNFAVGEREPKRTDEWAGGWMGPEKGPTFCLGDGGRERKSGIIYEVTKKNPRFSQPL